MKKTIHINENGKYRILQSCYWMMINVAFGYTTFYLGEYSYSPGEVGVLTASFSAISALCQPALGRLADRSRRFNWKNILLVLVSACAGTLALLTVSRAKLLVGLLFGLMALLMNCMMPMINSACFYYEQRGVHVDFGVARGLGSGFYAVISLVLGWLTVRIGTGAIPIAGLPILAILFLTIWSMPHEGSDVIRKEIPEETKANVQPSQKSSGFLKKYPAFCVMILACAMIITSHNFMTVYLLQILECLGGNTGHLGVALAIGAVTEVPILFLFSYIVKRCPASKLMLISGVSYIIKSTMILFAGNIGMIYVAHLLQPVSYGLYASATVYFTNDCMQDEDKVTGQSLMTMTMAIGSVTGNLIGGWLIDFRSVTHMMIVGTILAVAALSVVFASTVMYEREKSAER